ncbi:hypothetical protein VM1G_08071 [Cytospora mali]|uniref:Uncharacterized protein n=1 Tax=Cytospora mali TaxID=578113 RepID=A0A194W774_CYTMA|nr:hypothetical protein VM1G_08071 [Valsa mali]
MALNSPLAVHIFGPSTEGYEARSAWLSRLWAYNVPPTDVETLDKFDSYFRALRKQLMHVRPNLSPHDPVYILLTHEDLLQLIYILRDHRACRRGEIYEEISHRCDDGDFIVAKGSSWQGFSVAGEGVHPWNDKETFIASISSDLALERKLEDEEGREFSYLFNVWDIKRKTINFHFTDNLLEHLRIRRGHLKETTIMICHHATTLDRLRGYFDGDWPPGFDSDTFIDETLNTLALLIPNEQYIMHTRTAWSWYGSEMEGYRQYGEPLDGEARNQRYLTRRIQDYRFWRHRLLQIEKLVDESAPKGLFDWSRERLKGRERYAFWMAVLGGIALPTLLALLALIPSIFQAVES